MRVLTVFVIIILALLTLFQTTAFSELITSYMYLTNFETTGPPRGPYRDIIWFWTYDSLYGTVRSNDYIAIKYNPHFYGRIYTHQENFIYFGQDNPYFEYRPVFDCPPFDFPRSYPHLVGLTDIEIDGCDTLMTRLALKGEDGIDIHQFPLGMEPPEVAEEDALVMHLDPPDWLIMAVNGQCEIYGTLIGRLTVCSTRDMYLLDNITYEGADPNTGRWHAEEQNTNMEHMLGLISDRNIIIRNNARNGRDDGFNEYRDHETDYHSIAINGSLVALGESFTFEHQNDDWDAYQGPEPDKRGIIHLKGSLTQWRRGYVHRSNHRGTGYGKDYHYDFRLQTDGPPGFDPNFYPDVSGSYERLDLANGPYHFRTVIVRTLIVHPGVRIYLHGNDALTVRDSLIIQGTEERPVQLVTTGEFDHATLNAGPGIWSRTCIHNAEISQYVTMRLSSSEILVENSQVEGPLYIAGDVNMHHSGFQSRVDLTCNGEMTIERNVFEGGIILRGGVRDGTINQNSIVGSRNPGLEIIRFGSLEVRNNIIAFNNQGIENRDRDDPLLRYNDVFDNRAGNYIRCQPGEGSISEDPRFVNQQTV